MAELSNNYDNLSDGALDILFKSHDMLIGGQRVGASDYIDVLDPTNGKVVGSVPKGTKESVNQAVISARRALEHGSWATMRPYEREKILLKLADLIELEGDILAEVEAVESGRTLMNTRLFDVDFPVNCLRYMAGCATKIHGKTTTIGQGFAPSMEFFACTLLEPVGVVGGIIPWNVPLCQAIWKVAPALAAGCTVVLKPSEMTPFTALRLGELALEAGIPEGVFNIVTGIGSEVGAAMVEHPGIDKISFTGSTLVGHRIATAGSKTFKKMTLELGGKSPMIVMHDADLEASIPGVAMGIYGNHGQNCCAGSRLYVHEKVYDKVLEGLIEEANSIVLGSSLDPTTQMGPLASIAQQSRVLRYIESGKEEGAEIVAGGERLDHPGAYVTPTVLAETNRDMKVVQEEIFGPVLSVLRFKEGDDVVSLANDSEYGLGASIWTQNLAKAHQFVRQVKAGTVWVNTHNILDPAIPFGGVKSSGYGHEMAEEAMLAHLITKSAVINIT